MDTYAICKQCGSGLDAFDDCPICTEAGDYIDPRKPQETLQTFMEVENNEQKTSP